ncbi:MAG: hypothetical protein ACC628_10975 [Pirellulaceae bacterium]
MLVLIAIRLTQPSSEHALANGLEGDYLCDRQGRRYVACWKKQGARSSAVGIPLLSRENSTHSF